MECLRNEFHDGVLLGGRYKTISPLNHGSFGMVFKAEDLETNQTVAIKCLTKKATANEAGIDFAIDEKSEELFCHRRLGAHPNVVNLTDSFETDAHMYLVLEYCSRGDLYEAIRSGYGPLETEHVRRFMLELVDAVDYMHSKGIYHRDIKPENIFLTEDGSLKLGDFGLGTTEKWSYEMTVGSDRYMAPEQYDSAGAGYSPAQADIWAIGICLLNILFSRNPFTAPTEADPLFLDFSRDKQSLFDVFPTMSQDTYEVIVQCMNMDPSRRSLIGARDALDRVVSFTTLEEEDDEFCCAERTTIATANREPLRTPSIQSPQLDQGAFPWAKALHAASPLRQLSAIPDNESYTEDLFPQSEGTVDWMSSVQTPSIGSVLTSSLGMSMKSLGPSRPMDMPSRVRPRVSPAAGSLPISVAMPKANLNAMSMVFGQKKDVVSKSWSDMWDEDVEEDEQELTRQLEALKALNARTWSQESRSDATPTPLDQASASQAQASGDEKPAASPVDDAFSDIDGDMVADGFFFHEPAPTTDPKEPEHCPARYSPPSKRSGVDKWAALGDRRRAFNSPPSKKTSPFMTTKRHIGFAFNTNNNHQNNYNNTPHGLGLGLGVLDVVDPNSQKWNSRDRAAMRDCPWNKGRDNWNWRREKRHDFDVEWVGSHCQGVH